YSRLVLVGAEAEQRRNVADAIELRIIFDVEQLDVAPNRLWDDHVADVFDLSRLVATNRAEAHQMRIHMPAVFAFNRVGVELVSKQEYLNLAQFKGAENAAEPGGAIPVAVCLSEHFADQCVAAIILPVPQDPIGMIADLLIGDRRDVGRKMAKQPLLYIRMQMGLEFGPVILMTTDN